MFHQIKKHIYAFQIILVGMIIISCSNNEYDTQENYVDDINTDETNTVTYADIDFSNWKVTLPVDENNNGSPDEYQPNQLINGGYRTLEAVQPFMYDDTSDESIVFYTYPDQSTTNSKYSRTELRELINPNTSKENWTLKDGGTITGKLRMVEITKDDSSSREYHSTIVMQIHGIISQEDVARFNLSSNSAPPLIKMRWIDGDLWVYKKSLVNENTTGDALYDISSDTWQDEKHNMGYVGYDTFTFRITASDAKIELQLNDEIPYVYQDISLQKWPFENYFKAGNYLGTTNANAYSKVKYYDLKVTH